MKLFINNSVAFLLILLLLFVLGCNEFENNRSDDGVATNNTTSKKPNTYDHEVAILDELQGALNKSTVMMAASVRSIRNEGDSTTDFELLFASGDQLSLSELKGNVVVVNFWGSWCPPCRWEMPFFEEMWREYRGQGVIFIGIAVPPDTLADAISFAEHVGVTYPMGLDVTGKVLRDFGVTEFPTTFIFDRSGKQVRKFGLANKGVLRIYIKGQL